MFAFMVESILSTSLKEHYSRHRSDRLRRAVHIDKKAREFMVDGKSLQGRSSICATLSSLIYCVIGKPSYFPELERFHRFDPLAIKEMRPDPGGGEMDGKTFNRLKAIAINTSNLPSRASIDRAGIP